MLNEESSVRQVMVQLQEEYLETMGRLDRLAAEADNE
jgi:hypothetical protein